MHLEDPGGALLRQLLILDIMRAHRGVVGVRMMHGPNST